MLIGLELPSLFLQIIKNVVYIEFKMLKELFFICSLDSVQTHRTSDTISGIFGQPFISRT